MNDSHGTNPSPTDGAHGATDGDVIDAAWQQSPEILFALEGENFVLVAWNDLGRAIMQPTMGELGRPITEAPNVPGSGFLELLRLVAETGEAQTGTDFRTALSDESGTMQEYFFDFTLAPWRWPDGSIRGVTGSGRDVTEWVLERERAEAEAAHAAQQLRTSQEAMTALQSALLPTGVPVLPAAQVAARYLVAQADNAAGGDWFSAVVNPEGHLALVVGDVVGHGVTASATMGQLRAVLEERLRSGFGPAASLAALDRFAARVPDAEAATVSLALLDPETGDVEYCTAGHPPPLIIEADGCRYLDRTDSGPLGSGMGFGTKRTRLGPDAVLMLYSDGLVERPGVAPNETDFELAHAAHNAFHGRPLLLGAPTHTPDRVCEVTLEVLTRQSGYSDDITVLATHRATALPPLSLAVPPELDAGLTAVRHEVTRWLASVGASRPDQIDLSHVAVELVTNAFEHGVDPGEEPEITVHADLDPQGYFTLTVSDNGRWLEPPDRVEDDLRGLGLVLARRLTEELWVTRDGDTTVTACRHLTRPVPIGGRISRGAKPTTEHDEDEFAIALLPDEPGTLTVFGPVVIGTAEEIAALIDVESRGGTRQVTVDLSGVSVLASAGVRVLQRAQRSAEEAGTSLDIYAPGGSVAHHVLDLVGIAHRSRP